MVIKCVLIYIVLFSWVSFMTSCYIIEEKNDFQCQLQDKLNSTNCIKNGIQRLITYFYNGYQPLNISPIDPIFIKNGVLKISRVLFYVPRSTLLFNNIITGFKRAVINDVSYSPGVHGETSLKFDACVPFFYIEADYRATGRVFFMSVDQDGKCYSELQNLTMTFFLHGAHEYKNGKTFLNNINLKLTIGFPQNILLHVHDFFRHNLFLAVAAKQVIRQTTYTIYNNSLPELQEELEKYFQPIATEIFKIFPISDYYVEK